MEINFNKKYIKKNVTDDLLDEFKKEFKFISMSSFTKRFADVPERFFRLADQLSEFYTFNLYHNKENELCYDIIRPPYKCSVWTWSKLKSFCDDLNSATEKQEIIKKWCGPGSDQSVMNGKPNNLKFSVTVNCKYENKCKTKFCFNKMCSLLFLYKLFGWEEKIKEYRKEYWDNRIKFMCSDFYKYRFSIQNLHLKNYFDTIHLKKEKICQLLDIIDSGKCWITSKWQLMYPLDYKISDKELSSLDVANEDWNSINVHRNNKLDLSPCVTLQCDKKGICDAKLTYFIDLLIQANLLEEYIESQEKWEESIKEKYSSNKLITNLIESAQNNNMLYAVIRGADCSRRNDIIHDIGNSAIFFKKGISPKIIHMSMFDCVCSSIEKDSFFGEKALGERCKSHDLPSNQLIVIDKIDEFVNVYNDTKDVVFKDVSCERFIKALSSMAENKFIILVGTQNELEHLFSLRPSIKDVFVEHIIDIPDLNSDELFEIFKEHVNADLSVDFKNDFIKYLAVSKDRFPFNNEDLAIFLANTYNDKQELPKQYTIQSTSQEELNKMIGLDYLKEKMNEFKEFNIAKKVLEQKGIKVQNANNHMVFYGNPGTGKTTAARIVAKMLYEIGVLEKDTVVEATRKDFIAKYLGQTAYVAQATIDRAMGGVLFIDEAYSLCRNDAWGTDSYGQEAIATLIKAMEDHKDNLVIIFAGYKKEMDEFMDSNSGLKSRIGYSFDFPDYSAEELNEILVSKIEAMKFNINEDALKLTTNIFNHFRGEQNFGNGRFVDSLIQAILIKQTKRDSQHLEIIDKDIPKIIDLARDMYSAKKIFTFSDSSEYDCKIHLAKEVAESVSSYIFANKVLIEEINLEDADGNTTMYAQDVFEFYKNIYWSGKELDAVIITSLIGREAANLIYDDEVFEPINDTVIELITLKICNSKYIGANQMSFKDIEDINIELGKYKEQANKLADMNLEVIKTIIEKINKEKHLNREEFEKVLSESNLKTLEDTKTKIGF